MTKIIIVLSLMFFNLGISAQNYFVTDSMIKTLEQRVAILEQQKELLDQKFDNKANSLDNKFGAYKNEVDVPVCKIKIFFWLLGILGFVGIVSLIPTIISIRSRIKNEINNKLDAIFDESSERIKNLIAKESLEEKLKTTSKLLVVFSDIKSRVEVDQLFTETGFPRKNITYREINKKVPSLDNYDLIIQAIGKETEDADIKKYLDITGRYFVIFVKERKGILSGYRHNANVANSKFTLYGHIIDTLKFKK